MLEAQRALVRRGWHPAAAGQIVRRAAERALRESGLGKMNPTRSLRRDADPTIKPRPMIAGEQCVRIPEVPGQETALYERLNEYRNRGWNVMETHPARGFPGGRVFWACPPGRLPMEAQPEVLQSSAWGGPLYAPRPSGVGAAEDVLSTVKAAADAGPLKGIREAVSPWLWVTSVIGFGMGLLNTRRISMMFKNWRRKKEARA